VEFLLIESLLGILKSIEMSSVFVGVEKNINDAAYETCVKAV
jgi:hypothetical protein